MSSLLDRVRQIHGYDFQASTLPLLAALFEAASDPACDLGARCFGIQAEQAGVAANARDLQPGVGLSPAEKAVWGVALGQPCGGLDEFSFDDVSEAVRGLFLHPAVSLEALSSVFDALRAGWARAIMFGPLRVSMNWRATPHKAQHSASGNLHLLPYCQWCHATEDLDMCTGCSVVAYCSHSSCRKEDLSRHSRWCLDLMVSRLVWCALPPESLQLQELARRSPLTPYTPPMDVDQAHEELPRDWEAYFRERWPSASMLERCVLSESLSSPMTLLHIIEMLDLRHPRSTGLRLLVVGADCEANQPWIEALPYLPYNLEMDLVGPYLEDSRFEVGFDAMNRQVSVTCHQGLLQDVAASLGWFDLVLAFNSGMIFYPTWPAALSQILSFGCPFVVTAWALHEAVGVRQLLVDANFAEPSMSMNPFASRCPHRVTDDHGTTSLGNMALLVTAPRQGRSWDALLHPATGGQSDEDLRDTLRLIQGHLEVAVGVRAPLEGILDSPEEYARMLKKAAEAGREVPKDVARDMTEAYALLRKRLALESCGSTGSASDDVPSSSQREAVIPQAIMTVTRSHGLAKQTRGGTAQPLPGGGRADRDSAVQLL